MNRPSRSSLAIALAASGGFAATCPADFIGYVFDTYVVNVSGVDHFVCDIYGQFDDPLDTVSSVFNAQVSTPTGAVFHHDDFHTLSGQPGAWSVEHSGDIPGVVDASIDSFVLGSTVGISVPRFLKTYVFFVHLAGFFKAWSNPHFIRTILKYVPYVTS